MKATKGQTVRMAIAKSWGESPPEGLVVAPEDERLAIKTAEDSRRLMDAMRRMAAARDSGTLTEAYVTAQRFMNEIYRALNQNLP